MGVKIRKVEKKRSVLHRQAVKSRKKRDYLAPFKWLSKLGVGVLKVVLVFTVVGIISAGFLLLWLNLLGWVGGFLGIFRHLGFSISGTGYLLVACIGLLTIGISWLRGLFYYVAITPNYMNVQEGPTETGEQIGREDYNSRIDTGDFLERLLGFGRIVITFKEKSRLPMILLVWRVQKQAQLLENVRAKLAVDHPQSPVTPTA